MPEEYSVYDMAEDTEKAMDELGLAGAIIYGVSQGGMIAQVIALKRPDLVSRLVLCSTAPYIPEQAHAVYDEEPDVIRRIKDFALHDHT